MSKNKNRTRKSAASRFKLTKGGKVLHRSQLIRHLRASKSNAQIRRLKTMKEVEGEFAKKVKQMLGQA